MSANGNGRAPEGATADGLDAVQGIASTVPESTHVLPMGATPYFATVTYLDARDLMTEPADMGDALALEYAPLDALNLEAWKLFFASRGIA